jgi:hypothetical protein
MSAFNTVRGTAACPRCGRTSEAEVQFKYGNTWQYSYRLGDRLRWGGNDIGSPGRKLVVAEGVGGPCPFCKAGYLDFDVFIEGDILVRIEPVAGARAPTTPDGFLVIEP